jgi:hypothetical protein
LNAIFCWSKFALCELKSHFVAKLITKMVDWVVLSFILNLWMIDLGD